MWKWLHQDRLILPRAVWIVTRGLFHESSISASTHYESPDFLISYYMYFRLAP